MERLWVQPVTIIFGHGIPLSGSWHVPEVLVQFSDGSLGRFDVRRAVRIDDQARMQFAAAIAKALATAARLTGVESTVMHLGRG